MTLPFWFPKCMSYWSEQNCYQIGNLVLVAHTIKRILTNPSVCRIKFSLRCLEICFTSLSLLIKTTQRQGIKYDKLWQNLYLPMYKMLIHTNCQWFDYHTFWYLQWQGQSSPSFHKQFERTPCFISVKWMSATWFENIFFPSWSLKNQHLGIDYHQTHQNVKCWCKMYHLSKPLTLLTNKTFELNCSKNLKINRFLERQDISVCKNILKWAENKYELQKFWLPKFAINILAPNPLFCNWDGTKTPGNSCMLSGRQHRIFNLPPLFDCFLPSSE